MLPIVLEECTVAVLLDSTLRTPGARIVVDLEAKMVAAPDGAAHTFAVGRLAKRCLLEGFDEIGYTLTQLAQIEAFEVRHGISPIK